MKFITFALHKKLDLSLDLYDRITGPPPSFRECVTYGKSRNVVNDDVCDIPCQNQVLIPEVSC